MTRVALRAGHVGERGGALATAVFVTAVAIGLVATYLGLVSVESRQVGASRDGLSAFFIAEAGINHLLVELGTRGDPDGDGAVRIASAFGGGAYDAAAARTGTAWVLRSRGSFRGLRRSVEAVADAAVVSAFRRAATGVDHVRIEDDAFIDSYDSLDGSYARQVSGTYNGFPRAGAAGHALSGQNVVVDERGGVFGDASPGPSGVAIVGENAVVTGSTAPAAEPPALPSVSVPSAPSLGPIALAGTSRTIGPGTQGYDSIELSGDARLTIRGPAKIIVHGDVRLRDTSHLRFDTKRGAIELFVQGGLSTGPSARISNRERRPSEVTVIVTGTAGFAHDVQGAVHAGFFVPNGPVILRDAEIFGAVVGKTVSMSGIARLHFDVDLARRADTVGTAYRVRCWREVIE